ncbi:MAG: hypothetical protein K2N29_06185 [Ruminiclostridium sp.]|nr:hypothetical protein [Ruminiclostridium sp.]
MTKIRGVRTIAAYTATLFLSLAACGAEEAPIETAGTTTTAEATTTTASSVETSTEPSEPSVVPFEPGTTVSESEPPTWETDEHDGEPNPGMPALVTMDLMYGGEKYYLFIDVAPFIYGEDGKCYLLGNGYKTVQEPGYRVKENLPVDEALTAMLRDREPVGTLTYTDGALNADFEVTLKEFDNADLYENGNPKDDYGLTLVSTEPLCYVDGTAVYLTADATKYDSETTAQ